MLDSRNIESADKDCFERLQGSILRQWLNIAKCFEMEELTLSSVFAEYTHDSPATIQDQTTLRLRKESI